MMEGTEVSPNVRSAKTPNVKVQIGRADSSSSEDSNAPDIAAEDSIIVRLGRITAQPLQPIITQNLNPLVVVVMTIVIVTLVIVLVIVLVVAVFVVVVVR